MLQLYDIVIEFFRFFHIIDNLDVPVNINKYNLVERTFNICV